MPFLTVAAFGAILAFGSLGTILTLRAVGTFLGPAWFIAALALVTVTVAVAITRTAAGIILARTPALRGRWLGRNLQTLRLNAAQSAAQFFHFTFVGNFLAFGNFHQFEDFLDIIHHLLERFGNMRGIFHGLGDGGGFGGTEIGGLHPNLGALRLGTLRFLALGLLALGLRAWFTALVPLVIARLALLARVMAFLAFLAQLMPVFGAQRTLVAGRNGRGGRGFGWRLRGFPGGLTFHRFAMFRFLGMFMGFRRLMAVVLIMAISGFGGGVGLKFTRFAGFFGVRFAEAAGVIGFNRINPVVFRGMGMRLRSWLERFGHGGNGVAFFARRSGRGRKLVGSGAGTPAAATTTATPAVGRTAPGGRQIQI